jgi:biotin carboxyl carrier protein
MIYDVEVNGRTRRLQVERSASGFAVTIDGRRCEVDVTTIDGALSLILDDGRSFEVAIAEHPPASGSLAVHVNGRVVAAVVGTPRGSWARRGTDGGAAGAGPQRITAPMPGKVIKLLVGAGDRVAARQGVLVVEAMKMENELRAPRAGVVAEVLVSEGASVEAGAVLAIIE